MPFRLSRGTGSAILALFTVFLKSRRCFLEFYVRPTIMEDYGELYALWTAAAGTSTTRRWRSLRADAAWAARWWPDLPRRLAVNS